MGVLNVTPDSFFDGGQYLDPALALAHAERMVDEGAGIIDIGGESTRPGADCVSVADECQRVIVVIKKLRSALSIPISIDTTKPEIMQAAVDAGATMINDVNALQAPGALEMAARLNVPVCLMHRRGISKTMQDKPFYDDVVKDVKAFLSQRLHAAMECGIKQENILIDPGFGFGKNLSHNAALLRELSALKALGVPLLVGLSRKSMIGHALGLAVADRLAASLALATIAYMNGAQVIRVHDVKSTVQALKMTDIILHSHEEN